MSGALDSVFCGLNGVAKMLVDEYGTTAQVKSISDGGYDPRTGTATEGTAVIVTVHCSPPAAYDWQDINGQSVLQGDVKILVPATEMENPPKPGAIISVRGDDFQVVRCSPIASGNQIAVWEIQLRK